jgi:hypothetical protein
MGNFLLFQNRPEAYSVLVVIIVVVDDADRGDGDDNGMRKKACEVIESLSFLWPYF